MIPTCVAAHRRPPHTRYELTHPRSLVSPQFVALPRPTEAITTTTTTIIIMQRLWLFPSLSSAAVLTVAAIIASALCPTPVGAAVSAQCSADGAAVGNSALLAAVAPSAYCNILDVTATDRCAVDFAAVNADYQAVCTVGGKFIAQDITEDCAVNLSGTAYLVHYYYLNVPFCAGASCSSGEIKESFETTVLEIREG